MKMLKNDMAFTIMIFCLKISKVIHKLHHIVILLQVTSLRGDFLTSKEYCECSNAKVDIGYINTKRTVLPCPKMKNKIKNGNKRISELKLCPGLL